MKLQAIIFDLDGTLLDSVEDLAYFGNQTLEAYGFSTYPVHSFNHFAGYGARELIARATGSEDPNLIDEMTESFKTRYAGHVTRSSKLYEGIGTLLDHLDTLPVKKAILSNKPHTPTLQCHEAFLQQWDFGSVLGFREGFPRKPDPQGALEIAKSFGISPSSFCFIGDTATDIQTAQAAQMKSIGVTWGFRGRQELEDTGANWIVDDPDALLQLLRSFTS